MLKRLVRSPVTITLSVTALILLAAAGLLLAPRARPWLQAETGEEALTPQLRGAVHLISSRLRPYPATALDVPVHDTGLGPFGVNTFLQTEVEPDKVEHSLEMIHAAGFQWIRQEFPWEDLEIHHKGWYVDLRDNEIKNAWTKYDRIVALAEANQLQIIARLSTPPHWSRARGTAAGAFAPPDNLADYCDYVKNVVGRYRGRLRYFQIWNEPNIYPEWGVYDINPEQYTALLKVGYTCAKTANPEALILTAPLAPTIELTGRDFNDFLFLQRMYDAGAKAYFDILAVQDYGLWSGASDRRMRPRVLNFSRPVYVRDIMIRNGDANKAIWASEVGWNSAPAGVDAPFGRTPEEARARYAVEAFERIQHEWPWMGVVTYWFFKQADAREAGKPQYYFRLVEPDFTPTPAFEALSTYIQAALREPTMYRGYHQENHWTIAYSPGWTDHHAPDAVLGGYRKGQTGASLGFRFEGSALALIVRPDSAATIETRLDYAPPSTITIPGDVPPGTMPLKVLIAGNLGPGPHIFDLHVTDGALGLDGVLIR
ncbi:MAG: hypothetical protein M5U01_29140 [Ardenticatenaceae bacterium]|nr:hypothetical protein [Ardenticatenaceae bacterium]